MDHRCLGGVVRRIGHACVADTSDRGNVDNRTAALFFHDRDDVLHRKKAALEVHGEYPVPLLFGQLDDTSDMSNADVVVDDIDASIKIHARVDHATDIVMAGHVGTDCVGHA